MPVLVNVVPLNDVTMRLTVTVYVCIVVPSCAVTTTGIGLAPATSGIGSEAEPLDTGLPATVTVAFASVVVGVNVIDVVAALTVSL